MRKNSALEKLPNDLAQMFFSTGFMAEHMWEAAKRTGLREATIDILHRRVEPVELATPGVVSLLPWIGKYIRAELFDRELPSTYFTTAQIKISIQCKNDFDPLLSARCIVETESGHRIEGLVYNQIARPVPRTSQNG